MASGTAEQLEVIIKGLDTIFELLKEQNEILRQSNGATTVTRCRCGHTWPKGTADVHTCGLAA